jgi:hypothetical protein
MSGLLVSVRNAAEAEEALAGGADIIDVKEPSRGPLGRADAQNARDVIQTVSGRRLVSVALGELAESSDESRLDWLRGLVKASHLPRSVLPRFRSNQTGQNFCLLFSGQRFEARRMRSQSQSLTRIGSLRILLRRMM